MSKKDKRIGEHKAPIYEVISKVVITRDADTNLARQILDWVKKSRPIVVYKDKL